MTKPPFRTFGAISTLTLIASLAGCGPSQPTPSGSDAPVAAATQSDVPIPAAGNPARPPSSAASDAATDAPAFPASFRALGTEPFWAVHVGPDRLRYMTPEDQQGQSVPYTREQTAIDTVVLTARVGGKELVLKGRMAECSDGMSDVVYPFAVTLSLDGQQEQGCARPVDP